ncbi:hypothetical protein [Gloeocapsopsis sp. IPPAS B-1203]|uniref:hypothetical protein n=1 Tax=Gloeocapsopsis sp. IPPAS B-1203 TaxID=2049454 RepID=UPI000C194C37|nr:hypothetical protein [Gloeocapsopsis sp. IPPAS B-1203]PIG93046.1 hypothetical protein CSQ79_12605 [Gloeocapsopsis sp. IPPAS B-1203]
MDVNKQANELACRVYSGFQESSGTLAKSVDDFQTTTIKFAQTAQVFERSNFAQLLADATKDLYIIQRNFNHSTKVLSNSVSTIESAVFEVVNSNHKIQNVADQISHHNQKTVQALELHWSNQ